jgi:hypothetical protein
MQHKPAELWGSPRTLSAPAETDRQHPSEPLRTQTHPFLGGDCAKKGWRCLVVFLTSVRYLSYRFIVWRNSLSVILFYRFTKKGKLISLGAVSEPQQSTI